MVVVDGVWCAPEGSTRRGLGARGALDASSEVVVPDARRARSPSLSLPPPARQFIWFGLGASATIGTGIASIQTLAAAAHAPAAQLPLADAAQSLGIDVAGLITMIWLYRREEKVRCSES